MAVFDFRVLGPLCVSLDGRPHPLGRRRLRQLLLGLLAEPGKVVSAEQLLDAVWEDQRPSTGAAALHNLVGALRRWFDDLRPGSGHQLVRTEPSGYRLDVDPSQVDAHRFEALQDEGARALADGRPQDAVALLDQALALWRGVPFADADDGDARLRIVTTRLEELHRASEEAHADAQLRLDPDRAIVTLRGLVASQPLRERRWELYVLALYRSGRQRDALAALDEVRRHLRDELGADPSPRLQALHDAVLRHDPSLHAGSVATASDRAQRLRPVPSPVSSLVGRGDEVGAVVDLVGRGRLVTLTGPGGVGKTRLAIAAARDLAAEFPGGVAFVRLGPLRDAGGVLPAIAAGVGVPGATGAVDVETITDHLGAERVLLVLDTLEHLPEARLAVAELLTACGHLSVLTTSRSPLHLTGELRYAVPPLPVPDPGATDVVEIAEVPSVALFVQRVTDHEPAFTLEQAPAAVAAWCRHLGGVPLAIELAAARVAEHQAVLRAPAPRLDDLAAGPVDAPPRQRSVRATLDWSVARLSDDARRLFARLSVFRGMPALDAIAAVGAEHAHAFDELVRASLAIPQDAEGVRRVTMLDMVCEYARELLPEHERHAARSRHAVHYLAVVEAAGDADGDRTDALETDTNDVLAALDHLRATGQHGRADRLVRAASRHTTIELPALHALPRAWTAVDRSA